jgi:hypothetical protein
MDHSMVARSKSSKWRFLQFRLRTLLVIPALIATYFALGIPTKTMGVRDVSAKLSNGNPGGPVAVQYFAPLLLAFPILEMKLPPGKPEQLITKTDYYFWFFGLSAKLPYKTEDVRDMVKRDP